MKRLRYQLATWLFDLAARVFPLSDLGERDKYGESHHVGEDRWLDWTVERVNTADGERRTT